MMPSLHRLAGLACLLSASIPAVAQFPPEPEDTIVVSSKLHPGVTISYKEPGICETTEGVKSYSGYVHLPENEEGLGNAYPINTFFWFFEARNDPANAPLSIWINGGPGSSSLIGLFQENGPCHIANDSATTVLNPWSWNTDVNMLYIDQPAQVGFSYDTPTNGTLNLDTQDQAAADFTSGVPETNTTFLVGTFPSLVQNNTANTTENAAHAFWHFAQVWFAEFPQYKPKNNKVSLWTESYGGRYGPSFMAYFEEQNKKIENGTLSANGTIDLHLDTLGIINGCIDMLSQEPSFPHMAFNNTYGIRVINETVYKYALDVYEEPGGCKDLIIQCQNAEIALDPTDAGNVASVNAICQKADNLCEGVVEGAFFDGDRGYYDIAHPSEDPFPPEYFLGYLAENEVQGALGVPINYTESINSVYYAFSSTGDYPRGRQGRFLNDIAYVLDSGIKVALVFGDRDYACNWIGGENVSLNVDYSNAAAFRASGYADVHVNETYVGGMVRQHGNFSFTRVFESGHEVPAYQPETAFRIFSRALSGLDIATGKVRTDVGDSNYSTKGPSSTWQVRNEVPPFPEPTCYILSKSTCTSEQWDAVMDGTAVIEDYIVVDYPGSGTNGTSANATRTSSHTRPKAQRKRPLSRRTASEYPWY